MHRKCQRHPQHHRKHRRAIAPGVMPQFLPGKGREEGPDRVGHGLIVVGAGMIAASPGVSGASWTEKYPMNLIWVMPA